jgi:hypothetical protein
MDNQTQPSVQNEPAVVKHQRPINWSYPEVIETAFTREQACALIRRSKGVAIWVKTLKGAQTSFKLTKPEAVRQINARFGDDLPPIAMSDANYVWIG